jgi:hypothetical protein
VTNATAQVALAAAQVALATTQANAAAASATAAATIQTSAALEANKLWLKTGSTAVTLNNGTMSAGQVAFIYQSDNLQTQIGQGAGVIVRLSGTALTGGRFLAGYGSCAIRCITPTLYVLHGDVT